MESAQAAQAQVKKEQHNKSRQNNPDGDPEAPQLDELIPDKLARPEHPLEKAIDFLKPLQQLARDNIETHMLAFEIYYRKNKLLLMLQSIKRARAINPNDARLHLNVVRFNRVWKSLKSSEQNDYVTTVVEKEGVGLFDGKTAKELNAKILKEHAGSFNHVFNVAKAMYELDSNAKDEAVQLVINFPMEKLTLEVSTHELNNQSGQCLTIYLLFNLGSFTGRIIGIEYTEEWIVRCDR